MPVCVRQRFARGLMVAVHLQGYPGTLFKERIRLDGTCTTWSECRQSRNKATELMRLSSARGSLVPCAGALPWLWILTGSNCSTHTTYPRAGTTSNPTQCPASQARYYYLHALPSPCHQPPLPNSNSATYPCGLIDIYIAYRIDKPQTPVPSQRPPNTISALRRPQAKTTATVPVSRTLYVHCGAGGVLGRLHESGAAIPWAQCTR